MSAASKIDLLNESRYFSDIPRAFLEIADIVDLADLHEGILGRIRAGSRIVIANHRQGAGGSYLAVELHQFGNSRLAAPRPKRHQYLNQISANSRRILGQLDHLSGRGAGAPEEHRFSLIDHFGADAQQFFALIPREHRVFGGFDSRNRNGIAVRDQKIDLSLKGLIVHALIVAERGKTSADDPFDGFRQWHESVQNFRNDARVPGIAAF